MNKIIALLMLFTSITACDKNKIIYVADHLADCSEMANKKCLQVKEQQEDEWTLLADQIENFDYEEGFNYKIEVKINKIKNPPEGEAAFKYKLVKIIYQNKKPVAEKQPQLSGNWEVANIAGISNLKALPTFNIDPEAKRVSGNSSCNNYSASITTAGEKITFGLPMATKMYCAQMETETAFFNCLNNAVSFKLVDGQLKLYSQEGEVLLTCNAIED